MNSYVQPERSQLLNFLRRTQDSQFVIPVYQRNYTWTFNKELKQFLDDLEMLIYNKENNHFLGILIYLITPVSAYGSSEFSVIDGQQRLTTTFLTLYAIRDTLIELGEVEKSIKLESITLQNSLESGQRRFKLKPLVDDEKVYQKIVQKDLNSIIDKKSNVFRNYNSIREKIDLWLKDGYTVEDLLLALDRFYIVTVPISDNDDPQKIFESINSTGAKLTASDLIRNYILMDLPSNRQDYLYNNYWKKIEKFISNDPKKLESFFRFFLSSKFYNLTNKSSIYREFKIWMKNFIDQKEFEIEDVFSHLLHYARLNYRIFSESLSNDTDLSNSILEFRKNISDMATPFLLEMFHLNEPNENNIKRVSDDNLSKILITINSYLMRRALAGLDTSDITRLFPKLLKDTLDDCKNGYENVHEYFKKNLVNRNRGKSAMMPDDLLIRNHLRSANAYSIKFTIRIAFEKLENYHNSAPVLQENLSIEHLMPQTPTKYWMDASGLYDREEYERYLNMIGNLTLASKKDNSKMRNDVWEYKKQILQTTSHLKLNELVLKNKNWTKADIEERTDYLIDRLLELYPYESAKEDFVIKHEIHIDTDGITATGYLYETNGSVEILEGSMVKLDADENSLGTNEELYSELLDEGIIVETPDNASFKKAYRFNSLRSNSTTLSTSASFILRSPRNGWYTWRDEQGNPLNSNKELKRKLNQQ